MRHVFCFLVLLLLPSSTLARPHKKAQTDDLSLDVVYMERADRGSPFHRIDERERIEKLLQWMDNEAADFALRLYRSAWQRRLDGQPPVFYIALEAGGNHASQGFTLIEGDDTLVDDDQMPFILLDEQEYRFSGTLLHETGHLILGLLGAEPVDTDVSYVFHTTPAVTDRWTAFNEGFAQHLETIYAERVTDPDMRLHFDNRSSTFGPTSKHFFGPAMDLRTLSQTWQRFNGVRDNRFAHPAAYDGPDLLRHAIDPERDLSRLRNSSQLLACEGFVATVFYRLGTTSAPGPLSSLDYEPIFDALAKAFQYESVHVDHLWLLHTINSLAEVRPEARTIFLDLSRLTTVSNQMLEDWPQIYDAGLRVNVKAYGDWQQQEAEIFNHWVARLEQDHSLLAAAVAPEVFVCVDKKTVVPQLIQQSVDLCFDLNAATIPQLRAIDGADEHWLDEVVEERLPRPFQDLPDLGERAGAEHLESALVSWPANLNLDARVQVAMDIVGHFADQHGWKELAEKPFHHSVEVFDNQEQLWQRILALHELNPETPLPTDGLSAALEKQVLMAVNPLVAQRIRPEYPQVWEQLLAHEMTHRLHVRVLNGDEDAMGPTWFFEGFAVVGSGQPLGVELSPASAEEALELAHQDGRGSYARYAAALRFFGTKAALPDLVAQAGKEGFEEYLLAL
ncbi:MAG: hypothetical protein HN348_06005 [Proteobacteria bacterium]|nr:hypothetical protein [Pseudomonadota bacterium]